MSVYGVYFKAIGCHIIVILNLLAFLYVAANGFMGYWLSDWSADFINNKNRVYQENRTLSENFTTGANITTPRDTSEADLTRKRLLVFVAVGLLQGNPVNIVIDKIKIILMLFSLKSDLKYFLFS